MAANSVSGDVDEIVRDPGQAVLSGRETYSALGERLLRDFVHEVKSDDDGDSDDDWRAAYTAFARKDSVYEALDDALSPFSPHFSIIHEAIGDRNPVGYWVALAMVAYETARDMAAATTEWVSSGRGRLPPLASAPADPVFDSPWIFVSSPAAAAASASVPSDRALTSALIILLLLLLPRKTRLIIAGPVANNSIRITCDHCRKQYTVNPPMGSDLFMQTGGGGVDQEEPAASWVDDIVALRDVHRHRGWTKGIH